jgi:hypothetical protein
MNKNNLFKSQDEYDAVMKTIDDAVRTFKSIEDFEQYLDDVYDDEYYVHLTPREKEIRKYIINTIEDKLKSKPIGYLLVTRDDEEYDTKLGFESFTKANEYRCKCQSVWMGHCDYIYHIYTDDKGSEHRVNLTKMKESERKEYLSKFNIKY